MKTLKTFLEKHDACADGFEFAKDLTLEQFLETCQRGDWIFWLFARTNPNFELSLKELTLAKAHCANTVRHLMTDKRSLKAVDVALAFGEGRATREELAAAASAAADAYVAADAYAGAADAYAGAAYAYAGAAAAYAAAAVACLDAYAAAHSAADAARAASAVAAAAAEQNRKQTADICRKFLPIEIWDQSKF